MASRLLSRSKTLTLALTRSPIHSPSSLIDPIASYSQPIRCLYSFSSVANSAPSYSRSTILSSPAISAPLGYPKKFSHEKVLPRWFCAKAQGTQICPSAEKKKIINVDSKIEGKDVIEPDSHVICFSPLEAASAKARSDGLVRESLKIKRYELSQKITFALIPPLLLLSKSSFTTSLLVVCVYWQIYGFFKEIFLDYVHHEVTREWVLAYFKILLLILAKDTIINFGLV